MFSVGVAERPVHYYVPDAAVEAVDCAEEDEEGEVGCGLVETEEGEGHVGEDREGVFAAVYQMWKDIARVVVAPDTLQGAPDSREGGEET